VVAEVPEEQPVPPVSGEELLTSTDAELERFISVSRELLAEGRLLSEGGQLEEAHLLFQQALDLMKDSGFDFFLNPDLDRTYYEVLSEIHELEVEVQVDTLRALAELEEVSPLDQIADLDLYTIQIDPHLVAKVNRDVFETRFDIPVVINDSVLRFLNYYQTRGRKFMEEGIKRSGKYIHLFRETFLREQVPQDLIYMAHVESNFKATAYSRARAKGLWQFIRGTGRLYGLKQDWWIDERSDIVLSTEAAARHLKDLYAQFQDWHLALAAYNGGPGRVQRALDRLGPMDYWEMAKRRLLPRETRNYVPSILASIIIFRNPERYGFFVEPDEPLRFDRVLLEEQIDLQVAAEEIGVPVSVLRELNPGLRRGITPFEFKEYSLNVPEGTSELFRERMAALPPEKKLRFSYHRVRKGETLSKIAGNYAAPLQAIAQVNRIRNINRLQIGQELIIPLSGASRSYPTNSARPSLPADYVVRRGDSLSRIAIRYGVTVKDLALWNGMKSSETIYPGQRIRILASTGLAGSRDSRRSNTIGDR